MLEDLEKKSLMGLQGLVKREFMGGDLVTRNATSVQLKNTTKLRTGRQDKETTDSARDNKNKMITPSFADGTLQGKERLWSMLQTRNVTEVDSSYWASVPTWDEIISNLYGKHQNANTSRPIVYGLETCETFQDATSSNPSQRRIAPAGMFNTGTNYLSVLLEYNCQNPHRVAKFNNNPKRGHGNEWEVLWGKHTPAHFRGQYYKNEKHNYDVHEVLPVVLIRNPYGCMKSTCRNSYSARWARRGNSMDSCPDLKKDGKWNAVNVTFAPGTTHHRSLAHVWNDWYGEYFYNNFTMDSSANSYGISNLSAPFPRLMVRFEDIIFFPYEVTQQICKCAGGILGHRPDDQDVANNTFHYVVRSAKTGGGHGHTRNGLIDSWVKYGSSDPKNYYDDETAKLADEVLDETMLKTFAYD